jgi:RNA polymerase sigma factor (sigma-70 family)
VSRADERGSDIVADVRIHASDLLRFIVHLGVAEADAGDVLQEVVVAAWRGRQGFTGAGTLRGWLFGIARRQALQFLRSKHRGLRRHQTPGDGSAIGILEFEDGARSIDTEVADRDAVGGAVATLPIDLREAVVLAFVVGMPLAEVAQVQGVPLGTVKSRLHTARQRLKAALADTYPERASARSLGGRLPDGAASS